MKIILSAESTIDTPKELLDKWGIPTIHFHLERNGETFSDDKYPVSELFNYTNETGNMCHTSAPNVGEYMEYFDSLLEDDCFIIHFTISSKLSSSYSNACTAAMEHSNIRVIDTRSTSGAIGLLVLYAKDLVEAGYTPEEIINEIETRKNFASTSFIINDLKFLNKGGRCSSLSYFATKLLKIRPVIETKEDGSFKMGKTYRGDTEKCIYKYVVDRLDSFPLLDTSRCYINISTCDEKIIKTVEKIVKDYGFKKIIFGVASPVNSYHAGPNVLGVHFLYDGVHEVKEKARDYVPNQSSLSCMNLKHVN